MEKKSGDRQPILQIVHVSDLHVKAPSTAASHKFQKLDRMIRDRNLWGWFEGTQGHYPRAPEGFADFLKRWTLFGGLPPEKTWLVDTGDRTSLGDADSIDVGERYLRLWAEALGGCESRSVYGNHDAWPNGLPGIASGSAKKQRILVQSRQGWNPDEWIRKPLVTAIPGDEDATIRLFAADTVCWGATKNLRAVGEIKEIDLATMADILKTEEMGSCLRILAMHHPIAFPWEEGETRKSGMAAMRLLNDHECIKRFNDQGPIRAELSPWFHLFLSGHTHRAHPGHDGVDYDITDIRQDRLSAYQLQLVGGPLMLNKHAAHPHPSSPKRLPAGRVFSPTSVDHTLCQAQILRFCLASNLPKGALVLERYGIYSPNSGVDYFLKSDKPDDFIVYYKF
jgi:Calcineurin-like phosphoesterase